MNMRRVLLALFLAASASAANAELLQCSPEPGRLQITIDGFGRGERLPHGLETFRAFIRAGADEYEIFPEHLTSASMREDILRIRARRVLWGDEAAELTFEGKAGADGVEFPAQVTFRSEGRVFSGTVRCRLL